MADAEWDNPEEEEHDEEAHHKAYERNEYGHQEHIAAEGEEESPEAKYFQEGGLFHGLTAGDTEFHERLQDISDEHLREALQKEGVTAYLQKKRAEAEKKTRARQHATAAERARQGALSQNYEGFHSKRLINVEIEGKPNTYMTPALKAKQQQSLEKDYIKLEALRSQYSRHLAAGGSPQSFSEYRHMQELRKKLNDYRPVEKPDQFGRTTTEANRANIEEHLKNQYPNAGEIEGLRPTHHVSTRDKTSGKTEFKDEPEDLEYTVGKYGQENLGAGWKSTHKFQVEQLKRKFHALKTGEASLGWGELGNEGYPMGVAPEKAKVTIGSNQDIIVRTGNWTKLSPGPTQLTPEDKSTKKAIERHLRRHGKYKTHTVEEYSNQGTGTNKTEVTTSEIPVRTRLALEKRLSDYKQPLQDHFTVELNETPDRKPSLEEGHWYTQGARLQDTLKAAGITNVHSRPSGKNKYELWTDENDHLNPDQIDALKLALHTNYGVKSWNQRGTAEFAQEKKRVPVGYNKLPKDIDEEDIVPGTHRKNMYSHRIGVQFGQRDPISGNLLEGERESVGMVIPGVQRLGVGPRALQYHMREDTDADLRRSNLIMAGPRAHRSQELAEAYEASLAGNNSPMSDYIKKYHPETEDAGEVKEQEDKLRREGKELVAAGFGAAYYSHKKHLPARATNYTLQQASRVPGLRKAVEPLRNERTGTFVRDINLGYGRPLASWMERTKVRAAHPLSSVRYNPATQAYETNPTVPGVMFHKNDRKLNLPFSRYRERFISPQKYEQRRIEKKLETLKDTAAAREHVQNILTQKEAAKGGRLGERYALWQGKSMLMDPFDLSTDKWRSSAADLYMDVSGNLEEGKAVVGEKNPKTLSLRGLPGMGVHPELRQYMEGAQKDLAELLDKPSTVWSKESLERAVTDYGQHLKDNPTRLARAVPAVGKASLVGGAALTAGVVGVDAYQTYKHNKHRLKMPDGKDISGEELNKDRPLFGHIKIGKTAPIGGSLSASVFQPSAQSTLGPTKNMYIKGHKVPLDITLGRKETWNRRSLTAKNNPYKLTNKDREHLVYLAQEAPHQEEQIRSFYAGDKRLEEMLEDKKAIDRAKRENKSWRPKKYQPLDELAGGKGVSTRGTTTSKTLEQFRTEHRQQEQRSKELRREKRARS